MARDEEQAVEIAALIVRGCQTEEARRKMGIGIVRAQRIRAVAVRLGLIQPRFRAAWPEASKASARQRPQAVKSEQP